MFVHERHNAIKKIVRRSRRIDFAALQRLLDVSPATLRRDLTDLESAGDVIRVHGGVLDPAYVRAETSFDERLLRNGPAKKAIAAAAVSLVPGNVSVFIDAGSTCLEAGKALLGRKDVRLVTHSVALLESGIRGAAEILCIGGELRKVSGALVGGAALGALARLHVDMAFVGASGLHPTEGCTTTELSEAEMKRAILTRASRRVLLADSSKWGRSSAVCFAGWKEITDWISDELPSTRELGEIRTSGVKIRKA